MPVPLEYITDGDWPRVRSNQDKVAQALSPPAPQARVAHNANQPLTTGVTATLQFNTERWDNGDLHSTSVNPSRLTAPIAGLYSIGAQVTFAANATGFRYVDILLNGATIIGIVWGPASPAGSSTSFNLHTEYRLAAGDFVEVRAVQSSGGNLDVVSAAAYSPDFWMHRVAGYVNQGV